MADNTYKFYLKKDENTYFHVSDGYVSFSTSKVDLGEIVADWEEAQVAFKRNMTYWAVFREYSVPMKFVLNGARILRHVRYSQGFLGQCIFYIEKLNFTTRQYEYWYDGDIDFSMATDDDDFFQANMREKGLVGLLRNREDIDIEIDLEGPVIDGFLDGVKLGARSGWMLGDSIANDADFPPLEHFFTGTQPNGGESIPTQPIGMDIQAGSFIIPRDQNYHLFAPEINTVPFSTGKTAMKATADWYNIKYSGLLEMRVNLEAFGSVTGPPTYKIEVYAGVTNSVGSRVTSKTVKLGESSTIPNASWTEVAIPLLGTIDQIDNGSTVTIYTRYVRLSGSSNSINRKSYFFTNNSVLYLDYQAMVNPTQFKGFRYIDFFKKIIEKLTDGQYTGASNFLSNPNASPTVRKANFDNSPYNTIVTSGDGLRSITGAKIKTNLKQLFEDVWSRWCCCLSIDGNVVRLEPMQYYFSNDVLLDIDLVKSVRTKTFNEKIFNEIAIGYGNYDNDNVEGKNEFNTGLKFLVDDNVVVKKKDDSITPFRSDIYGIESIRAETLDTDKKDNRSDNDTFVIEVNPVPVTGRYVPYRPSGTITGVDDPVGVYNVALSPGRALRRHLPRIRSIVKTGLLKYQTIDKNSELQANIGTGLIIETGDMDLTQSTVLGVPVDNFFTPDVLEIECSPSYRLSEILATQTKGCLAFPYNGSHFKGYILDVACNPATRETYTVSLLNHPDNDLEKLHT